MRNVLLVYSKIRLQALVINFAGRYRRLLSSDGDMICEARCNSVQMADVLRLRFGAAVIHDPISNWIDLVWGPALCDLSGVGL